MKETADQLAKRLADMIPPPMTEEEFWENEQRQSDFTFWVFAFIPTVLIILSLVGLVIYSLTNHP